MIIVLLRQFLFLNIPLQYCESKKSIICLNQMFRLLKDSVYKEKDHVIQVLKSYYVVF